MAHIMLLAHTETQLWSCMTSVGAAVSRESHVRHSLAVGTHMLVGTWQEQLATTPVNNY